MAQARQQTGECNPCSRAIAQSVLVLVSVLAVVDLGLWFAIAFCQGELPPPLSPDQLNLLRGITLGGIILAFCGIGVVHGVDKHGCGLRGRYRVEAGLNEGDKDARAARRAAFVDGGKGAIGALVTKQSIFAALVMGLLAAFQFLFAPAGRDTLSDALSLAALACLLGTLVTVLVSIECYSSLLRYRWGVDRRMDLSLKARFLDALSFYLLVLGLLLAVTTRYPPIAAAMTALFSLWLVESFYFPHRSQAATSSR